MKSVAVLIGGVALGATLVACATEGMDSSVAPVKAPVASDSGSPEASETKKARTSWGNGIYKVGAEIPPGQYATDGGDFGCYWERLKDTTGELDSVIASGVPSGPSKMTVKKSDKFVKFELGCTWTRTSS